MEGLKSLFSIFAFIFGAVFGSFFNVLIYRLPKDMDTIFLPSHCPHCKRKIPWYYNIPILSYIILRGKCAFCGGKISLRYPFVETLSGIALLFIYTNYGFSLDTFIYFVFTGGFIVLFFTDLNDRILPDEITIGGTAVAILWSLRRDTISFKNSLAGAVFGFLILFSVWYFYKKIKREEGLGFGDIKLMALLGALFGVFKMLLILVFSSFSALIIGGTYMLLTKKSKKYEIPFGSFLSFWGAVFLFWGNFIEKSYLKIFLK